MKTTRQQRFEELRYINQLSQEDAAKLLGIPRGTLSNYESMEKRKIPYDLVEKMAKLYKTTPEYILTGDSSSNININTSKSVSKGNTVNIGDGEYKEKYYKTLEENIKLREELEKYRKN